MFGASGYLHTRPRSFWRERDAVVARRTVKYAYLRNDCLESDLFDWQGERQYRLILFSLLVEFLFLFEVLHCYWSVQIQTQTHPKEYAILSLAFFLLSPPSTFISTSSASAWFERVIIFNSIDENDCWQTTTEEELSDDDGCCLTRWQPKKRACVCASSSSTNTRTRTTYSSLVSSTKWNIESERREESETHTSNLFFHHQLENVDNIASLISRWTSLDTRRATTRILWPMTMTSSFDWTSNSPASSSETTSSLFSL